MHLEIICLVTLLIAAISDLLTMEVDPLIFLVGGATEFTWFILHPSEPGLIGITPHERLLGTIALFGFMLCFALFSGMGGADVLAGSLCGFTLGYMALSATLIASVATLPFLYYRKWKGRGDESYPFIPFIFGGYLLTLILLEVKL